MANCGRVLLANKPVSRAERPKSSDDIHCSPRRRSRDIQRDTKSNPANAKSAGLLVGHPGLEPGANGLRTQRLALSKALFLTVIGSSSRPIVATAGHTGPRDRYDRASLLAKIHEALDAKAVTPDDAAKLIALIEGTLASRHKN